MAKKLTLADVTPFESREFENTYEAPKPTIGPTEYKAPTTRTPTGMDTVQNQMTGLLNQNSEYMQAARKSGERVAHSRGLLNSGLTGEYSQKAAIESSLPIAQQDAQARTNLLQEQQRGDVQGALAKQQYGHDLGTLDLRGRQEAALATMQSGHQSGLIAQEGEQEQYIQSQRDENEITKMGKEAELNLTHDQTILGIQNDHEMSLADRTAAHRLAHDKAINEIQNNHELNVVDRQAELNLAHETTIAGLLHDNNIDITTLKAELDFSHASRMAEINANAQMTVEERRDIRQNAHEIMVENIQSSNRMTEDEKRAALDLVNQTTILGIMNDHESDMIGKKAGLDFFYDAQMQRIRTNDTISINEKQNELDIVRLEKEASLTRLENQFQQDHELTLLAAQQAGDIDLLTLRLDFEGQQNALDRLHDKGKYTFQAKADENIAKINQNTTWTDTEKQGKIQTELLKLQLANEYKLAEMNVISRETIAGMDIDASMQQRLMSDSTNLMLNLQNSITNAHAMGYEPEDLKTLIDSYIENYKANMDSLFSIAGEEIDWGENEDPTDIGGNIDTGGTTDTGGNETGDGGGTDPEDTTDTGGNTDEGGNDTPETNTGLPTPEKAQKQIEDIYKVIFKTSLDNIPDKVKSGMSFWVDRLLDPNNPLPPGDALPAIVAEAQKRWSEIFPGKEYPHWR